MRQSPGLALLLLALAPVVRSRPQQSVSSAGHPGGYRSTLLQYLAGIQQELPADRRPDSRQQQRLADFLQQQQQQQQQLNRPQQISRPQQQISRPQQQLSRLQQQQLSRPQQQQQFTRPQQQRRVLSRPQQLQSGSNAPVTPVRPPAPSFRRRRPGGAIVFPGPAS